MKYGFTFKASAALLLSMGFLYGSAYADSLASPANQNQSEVNKAQGEAFLATNKAKPGVVTLPDGLQYRVITAGSGLQPKANDTVTVNYAGRLINGTEFDSSYTRGQPASFPVSGVIPGWVEALQLMKTGATWELYVPAALAYGERGSPPNIGPNEMLIFKVNLISVQPG